MVIPDTSPPVGATTITRIKQGTPRLLRRERFHFRLSCRRSAVYFFLSESGTGRDALSIISRAISCAAFLAAASHFTFVAIAGYRLTVLFNSFCNSAVKNGSSLSDDKNSSQVTMKR